MNWISFAERKPKEEPNRQLWVKFETGGYATAWSTSGHYWDGVSHWAEIEGPETDPVRGALRRIVEAVIKEGVSAERFLPRLEEVMKSIADRSKKPRNRETVTEQAIRVEDELMREWKKGHQIPPSKPDPFEEWFNREFRFSNIPAVTFGVSSLRKAWDAAMKYKEGL